MPKINKVKTLIDTTKKALKKKDDEITLLKTELFNAQHEKIISLKMPVDMSVNNFPERFKVHVENQPTIKIEKTEVKFPKVQDVKVLNPIQFPDVQNVKIINPPEAIKFPDTQKVAVDFPSVQKVEVKDHDRLSEWLPKGLAIASKNIIKGIAELLSVPVHVRLVREDKINPIYVTPVDENGKIIRGGGGESLKHMIPMMARPFNTTYIPTGGGSGRFTITANTPAKLVSKPTLAHTVTVTSLPSNAGTIFVGINSAVATGGSEQGAMLLPTGSATFNINDVSKIWVDGTNTSDVLTYAYTS
jgi:hypothetical protein